MINKVESGECFVCEGSGKVWHPDSHRDAYEGNKLRGTCKCPCCDGKGNAPRTSVLGQTFIYFARKTTKEKDDLERKRAIQEETDRTLRRSAINKLTHDELNALGINPDD